MNLALATEQVKAAKSLALARVEVVKALAVGPDVFGSLERRTGLERSELMAALKELIEAGVVKEEGDVVSVYSLERAEIYGTHETNGTDGGQRCKEIDACVHKVDRIIQEFAGRLLNATGVDRRETKRLALRIVSEVLEGGRV